MNGFQMLTTSIDSADSAVVPSYRQNHLEWESTSSNPAIIQQRFLPYTLPPSEGIECSAMCRQAESVGGDFYDLLALPGGELGIAIGDVCGKGVSAALMATNLQATLRAEIRHAHADLSRLMATVSQLFHESSLEHLYSTLFLAIFNPATRIMKYVNAGHPPPMIAREKHAQIEWLNCGGPPIGMFRDCAYSVGSSFLNSGDLMVAYTDGIIESSNVAGEYWGIERLVHMVTAGVVRTAIGFDTAIARAVDAFAHGVKDRDDMALVVLRGI
jgi:phosphoserine phosphatase RsbU/P